MDESRATIKTQRGFDSQVGFVKVTVITWTFLSHTDFSFLGVKHSLDRKVIRLNLELQVSDLIDP